MDAIEILLDDHRKIRDLFGQLHDTSRSANTRLAEIIGQLRMLLTEHSHLEMGAFYPALQSVCPPASEGRDLVFMAEEEHRIVAQELDQLAAAENREDFVGLALTLEKLVLSHVKEEEDQIFPIARQALSERDRATIGQRMEEIKRAPSSSMHEVQQQSMVSTARAAGYDARPADLSQIEPSVTPNDVVIERNAVQAVPPEFIPPETRP